MDLRAASDLILMPHMGVQPILVEPVPPLPPGVMGLILGRGSLTLQGLVVHSGIVDDLHVSEIQVLCSSPKGVFSISKGDRIAQLLLLPSVFGIKPSAHILKSMGSTGTDSAHLVVSLSDRPKLCLDVNGKILEGILDTGADRSIISSRWWPKKWPTNISSHSLQGLGYQSCPEVSAAVLAWRSAEGHQGWFTPYVLPLPVNLWGRDVLQGLGLVLSNEKATPQYSPIARDIMKIMGYNEGKGLGRHEQGIIDPLTPTINNGRQGLGFS